MQKKKKREGDVILSAQRQRETHTVSPKKISKTPVISPNTQPCAWGNRPETSPSCLAARRGGDATLLALVVTRLWYEWVAAFHSFGSATGGSLFIHSPRDGGHVGPPAGLLYWAHQLKWSHLELNQTLLCEKLSWKSFLSTSAVELHTHRPAAAPVRNSWSFVYTHNSSVWEFSYFNL